MNLSVRHFQQLLALERHRHFGKAAESLKMSQPALSRSVLSLENNLGVKLFDRSARGIEPTPNGLLFIRHGRRILAAVADLRSEFTEAQGRSEQKLSIACGHYPAELTVPGALSRLTRDWPQVQVNLEVTDWIRIAGLLEQGVCDLAVTELSVTSKVIDLASELISDREVFLVVHGSHPLLQLEKPALDDTLSYPWVCSHIPARIALLFGPGPVAAGDLDPDNGNFIPKIIASSLSTAMKLVLENPVVGVAPISVVWPYLQRGDLAIVPFKAPWMRLNYGFMWDVQQPPSSIAKAFMEHVRQAEARIAEEETVMREAMGV